MNAEELRKVGRNADGSVMLRGWVLHALGKLWGMRVDLGCGFHYGAGVKLYTAAEALERARHVVELNAKSLAWYAAQQAKEAEWWAQVQTPT